MTDRISADDVHVFDDEPRVLDLRLAEALGFSKPYNIRKLIERNLNELSAYADIFSVVEKNHQDTSIETATPRGGFDNGDVEVWDTVSQTHEDTETTDEMILPHGGAKSRGRGRPGREYHLTEPQALLICMFARTPNAAAVRMEVVRVFMEWRARTLPRQPEAGGGAGGWRDRPFGYDVPPPEPFRLADGRALSRADTELSLAIMRLWRHSADSPKMLELWRLLGLPMPEMAPPTSSPGRPHAGLDCLMHLLGSECGEGSPLVQSVMIAAIGGDTQAADLLMEHGMCVVGDGVMVTNSHPFVLSLFFRSRWRGGGHMAALRTLPGCYPHKRRMRGGNWKDEARGTVIPVRLIEEPVMAAA